MARLLEEQTILVDPTGGPRAIADGLLAASRKLDVDLVIYVDVGGDVLGDGSEPGLASPLCDAVMLGAAALTQRQGMRSIAAVFGACCDGELTLFEILERLASVAAAGGLLGVGAIDERTATRLEQAIESVPTEASAAAVECARGAIGPTTIRDGSRNVPLTPVGSMTFYFDPTVALASAAALANAVIESRSLDEANAVLNAIGVSTELDYERNRTATG